LNLLFVKMYSYPCVSYIEYRYARTVRTEHRPGPRLRLNLFLGGILSAENISFLSTVPYSTAETRNCMCANLYVYGTCFWYRIVQKPRSWWCWHAAFFEYVRMRQRRYIFLLCVKECCTRLPFSLCTVRREERDTLLYVEIVWIP